MIVWLPDAVRTSSVPSALKSPGAAAVEAKGDSTEVAGVQVASS